MTRSSDPAAGAPAGSAFGSFDALTRPDGERRTTGRRLQDRIAQRDSEQAGAASMLAAAVPLFAGAERRRAGGPDRRQGDPLSADRLDPPAGKPSYARFIPREEVGQVGNWTLNNFGGPPPGTPREPPPEDPAVLAERAAAEAARQRAESARVQADEVRLAREGGYQDGYRDGLAALEAFKHSHAAQTTAQVATLLASFQGGLDALEQQLATRVAGVAMDVARQVVRHELSTDPAQVVTVVREALGQMLLSARHIELRLHPEDQALVQAGVGEQLAARHARLVADPQLARGDCLVRSDIGQVDARVATRWQRAMAAMGAEVAWVEPAAAAQADRDVQVDAGAGAHP